uniref:Fucoxanthin-chlorophyll a/c light-harvesting protein n=2 Tax=Helicotheca tamesis TaxID=374047 RepID=A0A7S2H3Z1_9STRA|mmetsp:Transcript_15080/g.20530  ORF Transcript_15080/g.20530 Transcript_15080/m.20530 type:complete len:208 (+) Transcript_15080:70-693(+)
MMKLAIAALLAGSAAAFAPASQKASSTSLGMGFESELGAQPPLGLFDPLGMLENADQKRFDRLRYVELKHGRIAQLAFLGNIITRAGVHLPGDIDYSGTSFDSIGNGWAAISGDNAIPAAGVLQIFGFIGILELFVMKDSANGAAPGDFPGDFRNGYIDFGWDTYSEETKLKKRAIELNNGRAAQMGILGLMVHEQLGGSIPIVGQL